MLRIPQTVKTLSSNSSRNRNCYAQSLLWSLKMPLNMNRKGAAARRYEGKDIVRDDGCRKAGWGGFPGAAHASWTSQRWEEQPQTKIWEGKLLHFLLLHLDIVDNSCTFFRFAAFFGMPEIDKLCAVWLVYVWIGQRCIRAKSETYPRVCNRVFVRLSWRYGVGHIYKNGSRKVSICAVLL